MRIYSESTERLIRQAKHQIDVICKEYEFDFAWLDTSSNGLVIVRTIEGEESCSFLENKPYTPSYITEMVIWYKVIRELIKNADEDNAIDTEYNYSKDLSTVELRTDNLVVYYK